MKTVTVRFGQWLRRQPKQPLETILLLEAAYRKGRADLLTEQKITANQKRLATRKNT